MAMGEPRRPLTHRWDTAAPLRCAVAILAALFPVLAGTSAPSHAARTLPGSCGASSATGRAAAATVHATSASISLNIAHAAAGTLIIVRGTGWPADAQIAIGVADLVQADGIVNEFDSLRQATTTSIGSFIAPAFRLPRGVCNVPPSPGMTAQVVAHTSDGVIRASAPLAIVQTPAVAVDLPWLTLPRGATAIPVSGSTWAPSTSVSLVAAGFIPGCAPAPRFDYSGCLTPLPGAQTVVAVAAPDGRFARDVPIPPGLAVGTGMVIRAAVSAPPYGDLAIKSDWSGRLLPLTSPTLTLDHAAGPAGDMLGLRGDHWTSGETVVIEYCRSAAVSQGIYGPQCNQGPRGTAGTGYAQELGEAQVDGSGHLAVRVRLPTDARPGPVAFQARLQSEPPESGFNTQIAAFTITPADPLGLAGAGWPLVAGALALLALVGVGIYLWRRGSLLRFD